MPYYDHGPMGEIVMICQVCRTRCHKDQPKDVEVEVGRDDLGRTVYRRGQCKKCVCHDCVQLADDPARRALAPALLNQTTAAPFNLEQALKSIVGELGLGVRPTPEPPPRLHGPAPCACAAPARSRCISCDAPLCARCLKKHKCNLPRGR